MKLFTTLLLILCTICTSAQNKTAYDKFADSLTREGRRSELIPYFQKELKIKPKNENILRWLGLLYLETNQADPGEKYYREALAVNPKCGRCYFHIGRAFLIRKDTSKAIEMIDKAVSTDPTDAGLYSNRAKLKQMLGDKNGALSDLNKAVRLDAANTEYLIDRGIYNSSIGEYWLALADMSKAVELAPDNYNNYYQRGRVYYLKNMLKEALEDFDKCVALDSSQAELYIGRGVIYAGKKDYDNAYADYTKAIKLEPGNYIGYYNRALTNYSLEDMDGYCADINATYTLLKKNDPGNELMPELTSAIDVFCNNAKASYYYQRGIALYNVKKYDKAITIYTEGVKKFPGNVMCINFRGNAYLRLNDYKNAIADYDASITMKENLINDIREKFESVANAADSIALYEKNFWAYTRLTISECRFGLKQYEEALADINAAIKMLPADHVEAIYEYYNVRGNIFLALGKFQQALDDFDQCIKLDPTYPMAYTNRALTRLGLAEQIKIQSIAMAGGINSQGFNQSWLIQLRPKKKSGIELAAALADCNKAIALDPAMPPSYYVRGLIKKILDYEDYCYDLLTANNNGYIVEPDLLKGCR